MPPTHGSYSPAARSHLATRTASTISDRSSSICNNSVYYSAHAASSIGDDGGNNNNNSNSERDQKEEHLRNSLTSIYWMPTRKSRRLPLMMHKSDHVHYYHGGLPFCYLIYEPNVNRPNRVKKVVLGPDLESGQVLQVCVPGGYWKTGFLIVPKSDKTDVITIKSDNGVNEIEIDTEYVAEALHNYNNNDDKKDWKCPDALKDYEYSLIGEAVGPGFDLRDFTAIEASELRKQESHTVQSILKPFLNSIVGAENVSKDFDSHYDNDSALQQRRNERL